MARTARRLGALTGAAVAGLAAHDLRQRRHAVLRNFPVVGHFRYLLESTGPSCGSTSSRRMTRSGRSRARGELPGPLRSELLRLGRACGTPHLALMDPDRIEVVGERYASAPLREVFGYEPGWPLVSADRRRAVESLIGAPEPRRPPGPEAGEQAGFPGAGDSSRKHQDARAAGEAASEAG